MPRFDCLLFDLDGVIADSRYAITRSMNHALAEQGAPTRPEAELAHYIGPPLLSAFRDVLSRHGGDPTLAEACVVSYRERYRTASLVETLLYPGVGDAVERLSRSLPLAVATSKPTAFAEPILVELGLRAAFRAVVGPGLDAKAEPKAETVARALATFSVPGRAAIIGDRRHDVEAGQANGIATIGVTWGFGSRAELEAAGADHLLDTPEELVALVSG